MNQIIETHYTFSKAYKMAQTFRNFEDNEDLDQHYVHWNCILLLFISLEGYINFIGHELFPDEWSGKGRLFQRNGKYPGTLGKITFLFEQLEKSSFRDKTYYSFIHQMKDFRNKFSHAETFIDIREEENPLNFKFKNIIYEFGTRKNCQKSFEIAEKIIHEIHNLAKKKCQNYSLKHFPAPERMASSLKNF